MVGRCLWGAATIAVTLVCPAQFTGAAEFQYSEGFEYKEYIVKKGDTLWSISKRELEDGFQWPMVWRENLKINNPDQISPGQIIIIPIRIVEKKPIAPEKVLPMEDVAREDVVPKFIINVVEPEKEVARADIEKRPLEPLMGRDLLLAAGYITRVVPDVGEVTGNAYGRMTYGTNDEIYIKTRNRAHVGKKFYVIKKISEVRHPINRQLIGWLVKVSGVLETIESGTIGLKATVLEANDAIETGDTLDHYYDVSAPFIVGEPRRPQVSGHIIASNYMRDLNGTYDIVFVDKGRNNGLRLGDVLMTLHEGTDDKLSSVMQLVNVRKETALGLLIKSVSEVQKGDVFQGIR
jgi:hypothetical protein